MEEEEEVGKEESGESEDVGKEEREELREEEMEEEEDAGREEEELCEEEDPQTMGPHVQPH